MKTKRIGALLIGLVILCLIATPAIAAHMDILIVAEKVGAKVNWDNANKVAVAAGLIAAGLVAIPSGVTQAIGAGIFLGAGIGYA